MSPRKSQVQIEITDLDADKAVVEKIFIAVAGKFNLYDNTHESRVPETIKSIVEAKGFGFGLGARVVKELIFVHFHRPKTNSPKFDQVREFILNELQDSFNRELLEVF
jgi:hypothetical protein